MAANLTMDLAFPPPDPPDPPVPPDAPLPELDDDEAPPEPVVELPPLELVEPSPDVDPVLIVEPVDAEPAEVE
jgi:hypothetical protein